MRGARQSAEIRVWASFRSRRSLPGCGLSGPVQEERGGQGDELREKRTQVARTCCANFDDVRGQRRIAAPAIVLAKPLTCRPQCRGFVEAIDSGARRRVRSGASSHSTGSICRSCRPTHCVSRRKPVVHEREGSLANVAAVRGAHGAVRLSVVALTIRHGKRSESAFIDHPRRRARRRSGCDPLRELRAPPRRKSSGWRCRGTLNRAPRKREHRHDGPPNGISVARILAERACRQGEPTHVSWTCRGIHDNRPPTGASPGRVSQHPRCTEEARGVA